ncbi:glycosyltransferase [Sanguibacter antarcticus]|uniref:Glycosyl transferase family 4 n=1 Tax=Sanguibacter antarcticus TaxID=372484 RepID=A0A2A9E2T8_9MICO|nr:glycosyltransferase [Sanguibacter antarcticus]PFG32510.1 glycosyl transferase family 4 [Sanguibacter antarcticus]
MSTTSTPTSPGETGAVRRPRILCVSLSPIHSDARVLRQVSVLAGRGHVTTVGFGPTPHGSDEHLRIPDGAATLPQTPRGVALLALRRHEAAELSAPAVRYALEVLAGQRFDLVVANDARVLGLAHAVAARSDAPVWADMHEWAPEERTHVRSWRLLVAPFMTHLCRTYLPRSAAVTTVCNSIAELYGQHFGVTAEVMRNSSPYLDLRPSPVAADAVRLVHSGAAIHGRSLETMIDATRELGSRYTLDLYLLPGGDGGRYLRELKDRAADCSRVRFRDPVAPGDLPATLNAYDVGVFWIPPTHTNARYTLPNKFFDYVQARLAIAVGPSIEMARLVERYRLGVVSDGFDVAACVASLSTLDAAAIRGAKAAADVASSELSFETDALVGDRIVARLLAASSPAPGIG